MILGLQDSARCVEVGGADECAQACLLVDHHIQNSVTLEEVERACPVSWWCTQDHESDIQTMGHVVKILEGILQVDIIPPVLCQRYFKQFQEAQLQ